MSLEASAIRVGHVYRHVRTRSDSPECEVESIRPIVNRVFFVYSVNVPGGVKMLHGSCSLSEFAYWADVEVP